MMVVSSETFNVQARELKTTIAQKGDPARDHDSNVNSYHDDPQNAVDPFDFVAANPPLNVNAGTRCD